MVIGDLGHVKDLEVISNSITSNQAFGTANYLAPEAYDLRRSNKIDIWSFGCIVYELFYLEKLFDIRNPDKLRDSIRNFQADAHSKIGQMKSLYVKVVKKYLLIFKIFTVKINFNVVQIYSSKLLLSHFYLMK